MIRPAMWIRTLLVLIVSAVAVKAEYNSQQILNSVTSDGSAEQCCSYLAQRWPTLVIFNDQGHYYAMQQTEQVPRCRFTPLSSQHVSTVVGVLSKNNCRFAVRSGGHTNWSGSSNIDSGVVIDFARMRGIEVKPERSIVKLEPGLTWEEVYSALGPWNITVAGGRASSVGVGGLIMGGGISLLSYQHGFASDNVVNYQVVLSDGTVVDASVDSHPDLYWALKFGSTNYGIVTRFDVTAFPMSYKIPAGTQLYSRSGDLQRQLIEKWLSYSDDLSSDPKKAAFLTFLSSSHQILLMRANLESELTSYTSTSPIVDTTGLMSLADFTKILDTVAGVKKRVSWYTMTISADFALMEDLVALTQDTADVMKRTEAESTLFINFQPISKGFIAATRSNPVHSVLADQNRNLVLIAWIANWDESTHDTLIDGSLVNLGQSAKEIARQRGLFNGFVYMNYAHEHEKVYERSVSRENLAEMIRIKKKYDEKDIFGRLWQGGFKLPRVSKVQVNGDRTEL
ncbi:fad binding domain-containing protein [Moniliophthora roreri]|uniref:FAD-binding PCMH-type domain-containing protein n=1 Tax=Moniliophthora roreri TaxID=221103 RepID=A0A0W0EVV9_MONRR|nr:fad binding domain-containing protein [Moniliophthora roreri]